MWCRDDCRRRLEGLGDWHIALFHVAEVNLPRDVDARGVAFPLYVHLVNIVCSITLEEGIVGVHSLVRFFSGKSIASPLLEPRRKSKSSAF